MKTFFEDWVGKYSTFHPVCHAVLLYKNIRIFELATSLITNLILQQKIYVSISSSQQTITLHGLLTRINLIIGSSK